MPSDPRAFSNRRAPCARGAAVAAVLLLALPTLAAPARPVPSRQQLERGLASLANSGRIDAADYRALAALAGLPMRTGQDASAPPQRCGTVELAQVRQWAQQQGYRVRPAPLAAPGTGQLKSSKFPITVEVPLGEELRADAILKATEISWQRQVVDLGYPAPWTQDDAGAVRQGAYLFIDPSREYRGVTIPTADVPQTPRCDCACVIGISPATANEDVDVVVDHEFNHATQFATDCSEAISAYENFATAVDHLGSGRTDPFTYDVIKRFQSFSEYPVDFWSGGDGVDGSPDNYYQYGASLFPLFLLDRYGHNDPAFLRKLWDAFAQNGSVVGDDFHCSGGNHPNWFDGVDSVLGAQGADFATAFSEFAQWRAVVGKFDDGAHFADGANYAEPIYFEHLSLARSSTASSSAFEYGSRFVVLTNLHSPPATLDISGDPAASWAAALVLWRDGRAQSRALTFTDGTAHIALGNLSGVTRAVLAVSQLQDASHVPDDYDWKSRRDFSLNLVSSGGEDQESIPTDQTGVEGQPVPKLASGCSCDASAGGVGGPALTLAFALGALARRARTRRRG